MYFFEKRKNFILFLLDDNCNNNTGSYVEYSYHHELVFLFDKKVKYSNTHHIIILHTPTSQVIR